MSISGTFEYGAAEQALVTWVKGVTGFSRVILKNQKVPQQDLPYATIFLPAGRQPGGGPPDTDRYTDLTKPAGSEIEYRTGSHEQAIVQIEIFTRATVGAASLANPPAPPARDFAADLSISAFAYLTRSSLLAAGLIPVSIENVQDLSERSGPVGQGRALVEIRFRFVETWSDRTGYINTAQVSGTVTD